MHTIGKETHCCSRGLGSAAHEPWLTRILYQWPQSGSSAQPLCRLTPPYLRGGCSRTESQTPQAVVWLHWPTLSRGRPTRELLGHSSLRWICSWELSFWATQRNPWRLRPCLLKKEESCVPGYPSKTSEFFSQLFKRIFFLTSHISNQLIMEI